MKKIKLIPILFILVVLSGVIFLIDFRYSYKYADFKLRYAFASGSTDVALQYIDIEKVLLNAFNSILESNNNLKHLDENSEEFKKKKQEFITYAKVDLINIFSGQHASAMDKRVAFCFAGISMLIHPGFKVEHTKISRNTVKQNFCNMETNECHTFIFEKIKGKWIATGLFL